MRAFTLVALGLMLRRSNWRAPRFVKTMFALGQPLGQLLVFALQLLDPGDRCLDSFVQLLENVKSPWPMLISTFTLIFD